MSNTHAKLCSVAVVACLAALVVAALTLHQSFLLTALSDLVQLVLLLVATAAFVPRIFRATGRTRLFWSLISLGTGLWFFYQFVWTYFEVFRRSDVPDLFWGDIILFLHIVPFMAAVAVRPHVSRDEYGARVGTLDFALMIVWWIYLYVLAVMAWQYAVPDLLSYTHNLNALYLAEKIVLLTALAAFWIGSRGRWRTLYAHLFGTGVLYAASSYIANWALARSAYYSGSLYDIPLAVSMAWLALIGVWTRPGDPETVTRISPFYGIWAPRSGMMAAISVPLLGAWVLVDTDVPPRVRSFRVIVTLSAALVMGIMAFVRQRLLDRQLLRLLERSHQSIEDLKRLQSQVLQSEKLASIGQLVGGAAHELNNPITAMLGYSELLLNTALSGEQRSLAAKIAQQVRQTRSLVASLLSFARQSPRSKTSVDLNTLLRTAVKLTEPQWQPLNIEVHMELAPQLPKVLGDSNQLLQVCLQVIDTAVHKMEEESGSILTVRTSRQAEDAVVEICGAPAAMRPRMDGTIGEGAEVIGLSACQGIVQEHFGRIACELRSDGATVVRIELPANPLPEPASIRAASLLAQSQPSA